MTTRTNSLRVVPALLLGAALLASLGCPGKVEIPPPPAVVSFTASVTSLPQAGKVTLTWETQNATAVSILPVGGEPVEGVDNQASGSLEIAVEKSTLFVLRAENSRGVADSAAAQILVGDGASELLFTASPSKLASGQSAVLAWSASGAKKVTITDDAGNPVDLEKQGPFGSVTVSPTTDTTYTLKAGARLATTTVLVSPMVKTFQADPPFASAGGEVKLNWETLGAKAVQVELAGSGTLHSEADAAKVAAGDFTFTVPPDASNDAVFTFLLHAQGATDGVKTTREVVVYISKEPLITEFKVPAYAKSGGTLLLSWKTNANEVVLSAGGVPFFQTSGSTATTGSLTLPTPAAKTEYLLTARNLRGGETTLKGETDVVGTPSVTTFTAAPTTLATGGDPVTLTWNVPNARKLRIVAKNQHGLVGSQGVAAEAGTLTVYPNQNTEYELVADNQAGDEVKATATVDVTTPATLTFSASNIPANAEINVTGTSAAGITQAYGLPNVVKNAAGEAFVDISTTGTDIAISGPDTSPKLFTLPEEFHTVLYGVPLSATKLSVSINGWFFFSPTTVAGPDNNTSTFPTKELEPLAIAPYWDDLYIVTGSKVFVQQDGYGLDARLIVQWNEFEHDDYTGSRLTFQAQLYATGKVVFAYKKLQGVAPGDMPSVGIVDRTELSAVVPMGPPAENDTFTFFGPTPFPAPVRAYETPYVLRAVVGNSTMSVQGAPTLYPPEQFAISEIHPVPATGVVDGEWFEVVNRTANPIDLKDWVLNFGGGNTHTVNASLVIPPNGYVLLGQSATAGDGLAVDYVYGNAYQLDDAAGAMEIGVSGATYTRFEYSIAATATPPGASIVFDQRNDLLYATGVTGLACPSASTFGSNGQRGTPKLPNDPCPPYQLTPITGNFESIVATGTSITPTDPDEGIANVTLPNAIKIAHLSFTDISVATNGFVVPRTIACPGGGLCYFDNKTLPGTSEPRGTIAPFWSDLDANASNSGIFWLRKDPDATPNNGDEYTIISWENYTFYGEVAELNFQVKFFENGNIEFHYGNMTSAITGLSAGAAATTWFEEPLGRAAFKVNINSASPGITPFSGYRLTKL